MSQHDMDISDQSFPNFRTDLNLALKALASSSTGATAPTTTFAGQLWYDETTSTLKQRNEANDGWNTLLETLGIDSQSTGVWETGTSTTESIVSPEKVAAAASRHGLPAGTFAWYAGTSSPAGYLETDGSAVSRTTYADLFAAISTTYGVGDGSTTFNLPNTQDEFIRGAGGTQTVGDTQSGSIESHVHEVDVPETSTNSSGSHSHGAGSSRYFVRSAGTVSSDAINNIGSGATAFQGVQSLTSVLNTASGGSHTHTVDPDPFDSGATGDTETRPQNIAMLGIIKT